MRQKAPTSWKASVNPFTLADAFYAFAKEDLENSFARGEIVQDEQFLLFTKCVNFNCVTNRLLDVVFNQTAYIKIPVSCRDDGKGYSVLTTSHGVDISSKLSTSFINMP